MEQTKKSIWGKAFFWGFVTAVALMVMNAVYYGLDNYMDTSKSWVSIIISVAGIFVAIFVFRSSLKEDEPFSYGKALGLGVATSLVFGVLIAVFNYVMVKYIDPSIIDQMLLAAEKQLVERGMDDATIEQGLEMQKKMLQPGILSAMVVFSNVFYGLIISLILAAFLKKKNKDGYDAAMQEINDED